MTTPPNPLPEELQAMPAAPAPAPLLSPVPEVQLEMPAQLPLPRPRKIPAWSGWDLLAIVVFTLLAIFVATLVALFVARSLPQYRNASFTDLAMNARVVIGAQTAAYPIVLLFIYLLVRSRSDEGFGESLKWHWPGNIAPAFVVAGVALAIVVEAL